jgi:DNA-binding Lrp family transcriptional regulator
MPIAFVCIVTEPTSVAEGLKEIRETEGVQEAQIVYGIYDILVKVKTETMDNLKRIVTEHIQRIAGGTNNSYPHGYRVTIAIYSANMVESRSRVILLKE